METLNYQSEHEEGTANGLLAARFHSSTDFSYSDATHFVSEIFYGFMLILAITIDLPFTQPVDREQHQDAILTVLRWF